MTSPAVNSTPSVWAVNVSVVVVVVVVVVCALSVVTAVSVGAVEVISGVPHPTNQIVVAIWVMM